MERISRLWRREKQPEPEQTQKRTLPQNFAEELLNAELQLQSSPQVHISKVNRLIELYSIAVEYYESTQSSRYLIFKQKITQLLLNPIVSRTIDQSSRPRRQTHAKHPEGSEANERTNRIYDRRREIQHNLTYALRNAEGDVRYLIINANDRLDNLSKMIASGISQQESVISKRLKNRMKNRRVASRDSTDSDSREQPLQWEESADSRLGGQSCSIVEEQHEESLGSQVGHPEQTAERDSSLLEDLEVVAERIKEPTPEVKPEQKPSYTAYLLSSEEIERRRKKILNRSRRKLLTLSSNAPTQELPGQYSIPF